MMVSRWWQRSQIYVTALSIWLLTLPLDRSGLLSRALVLGTLAALLGIGFGLLAGVVRWVFVLSQMLTEAL